jgi:p-cumate 2,3-dioxygenase subunit alpha
MNPAEVLIDRPADGLFRVHRSTMVSPELFALEQERIFDHTWLYVGHESEVERPGDYRRRTVAGRPVFMVRGSDGIVRVFLNSCTHRGAQVCRLDEGNAAQFQCFYHAWTFDNRGALIGLPDPAGYTAALDRAERALVSPPRVDSYHGLYFISFDPAIESLTSYLGEAGALMDLTLDAAEVLGGWSVVPGHLEYTIHANWKLLVENSIDHYHVPTVHETHLAYLARRRAAAGLAPGPAVSHYSRATRGVALSHGHSGTIHANSIRPLANPNPLWSAEARAEVERVRACLLDRFGESRGRAMAEESRFLNVFPNFLFQDTQSGFRFRQIWPTAPDRMDVVQWDLVPREEREEVRAYRLEASRMFLGPGGLATPDDVEALESCQVGFRATGDQWSDISRGMHRAPHGEDELQIRAFWRHWQAMLLGLPAAPLVDESRYHAEAPPELEGGAGERAS